ncbi:MAG: type II toxin-antitoxin system VapC family toxin [Egibacteraceae bacterium]
MILLDTSGLLAALFPDQRRHTECAHALASAQAPLILSPFVLAELGYLIGKLSGVDAELALLAEVAGGAYQLASFSAQDVQEAHDIVREFRDLEIGLADASLVVLSRRESVTDVLTLDERHFRILRGNQERPFRLLPSDS